MVSFRLLLPVAFPLHNEGCAPHHQCRMHVLVSKGMFTSMARARMPSACKPNDIASRTILLSSLKQE